MAGGQEGRLARGELAAAFDAELPYVDGPPPGVAGDHGQTDARAGRRGGRDHRTQFGDLSGHGGSRPSGEQHAGAERGAAGGRGGVDLGEGEQADNRKAGLGPILGFGTGLGAGLLFGLVAGRRRVPRPVGAVALTGLAMLGSSAPMTLLGLTDPREWTASDWAADVIPHLAYGAVAAGVYDALR
ncbi:hypothetical protein [Actinomadura madurae]|uniref:hypothetical protein n=1 Tax=Actinomadura madurae TaxID=1993 RepID=UPI0020D1F588|nr:hypothetical protein [Actinomadura madurae]MCQ0017550.1 hypothetical protein [Actinomadura madurae]